MYVRLTILKCMSSDSSLLVQYFANKKPQLTSAWHDISLDYINYHQIPDGKLHDH